MTLRDYEDYMRGPDPDPSDDTEEEPAEVTPSLAIRSIIFDLMMRKADWRDKPDPDGVVPHIEKLIAALELAQWELGEYHKLRAALATLRAAGV